jgi:hypothetical protein
MQYDIGLKKQKMKKQTAVEWLINQVEDFIGLIPVDIIEQAKAMEKEQIVNALNDGWYMAKHSNFVNSDAEQYYNETYKKNRYE